MLAHVSLATLLGRNFKAKRGFPGYCTESRVKFLEKVV